MQYRFRTSIDIIRACLPIAVVSLLVLPLGSCLAPGDIHRLNVTTVEVTTDGSFTQDDEIIWQIKPDCTIVIENPLFSCQLYDLEHIQVSFLVAVIKVSKFVFVEKEITVTWPDMWLVVYNMSSPLSPMQFRGFQEPSAVAAVICATRMSIVPPSLDIDQGAVYAGLSKIGDNFIVRLLYYDYGVLNSTINCTFGDTFLQNRKLYHHFQDINQDNMVKFKNGLFWVILIICLVTAPPTIYLVISMLLFNSFLSIKDYMNDTRYLLENINIRTSKSLYNVANK